NSAARATISSRVSVDPEPACIARSIEGPRSRCQRGVDARRIGLLRLGRYLGGQAKRVPAGSNITRQRAGRTYLEYRSARVDPCAAEDVPTATQLDDATQAMPHRTPDDAPGGMGGCCACQPVPFQRSANVTFPCCPT